MNIIQIFKLTEYCKMNSLNTSLLEYDTSQYSWHDNHYTLFRFIYSKITQALAFAKFIHQVIYCVETCCCSMTYNTMGTCIGVCLAIKSNLHALYGHMVTEHIDLENRIALLSILDNFVLE